MKQWFFICVFIFSACGGGSKPSRPYQPPVEVPTISTVSTPTPYPTPSIDLTPYLHQQGGRVLTVSETQGDLGAAINSINESLGSEPGKILVTGGGSIRTTANITHDFEYHGSITCDLPDDVETCFSIGSNVQIEGFGDAVHGPTGMMSDGRPQVTVFKAASAPHGRDFKITFKNVWIEGRNPRLNDGGYRQMVSLGNCVDCAFIDSRINKSPGISLQFGGTSDNGYHALRGLIIGSTFSESAAAHVALVNVSEIIYFKNTITRPGQVGGPSVPGLDIETNSTDDWANNITVDSSLFDFQQAAFNSAGSAILAQQRGIGHANGLRITNNRIIASQPLGGLTSAVFFTGEFPGGLVANNYMQRAGQPCVQAYGSRGVTFQDNVLVNCGGGGLPAVLFQGGGGNTWLRNPILYNEAIGGSVSGEIWAVDSQDNKFDVPVSVRN